MLFYNYFFNKKRFIVVVVVVVGEVVEKNSFLFSSYLSRIDVIIR